MKKGNAEQATTIAKHVKTISEQAAEIVNLKLLLKKKEVGALLVKKRRQVASPGPGGAGGGNNDYGFKF